MSSSPSSQILHQSSSVDQPDESDHSSSQIQPGFVIEEIFPDQESAEEELWQEDTNNRVSMAATTVITSPVPDVFTTLPPTRDFLSTQTSIVQDETVQECLPFLAGFSGEFTAYNRYGIPHLDRARHARFLHKCLRDLPPQFVAADAARPWFFYWVLCGLSTLGEHVESYRERLVNTVRPAQNSNGGFGGGFGQMSHLATTYATVLALVIVGGDAAYEVIDRKAMWRWLGELKQPDGGFQMSIGGEVDVRGAYCAATLVTLLDLPLELPAGSKGKLNDNDTLFTGLPEYVGRCQSFEGGIASRPDGEAHGAYAFCALACLCILGDPKTTIPRYLDVPRLVSWLSARQYAPEGGFAGRTNKLVDGCYSAWLGGCWPLLGSCLTSQPSLSSLQLGETKFDGSSLYSREGLIRYILCCAQDTSTRGGMRDKPGMNSDAYHTCYVLAGLSSAQHKWSFNSSITAWPNITGNLISPYQWKMESLSIMGEDGEGQIFDEEDRVGTVHPVFNVPEGAAERTRAYFAAKENF